MPFAIPTVWREQTNHISDLILHGASPAARFFEEEKVDPKLSEFIIIIILLLLLLFFTAIGFSSGGSRPYTRTHNTNDFTRWQ
jgi:predicted permease